MLSKKVKPENVMKARADGWTKKNIDRLENGDVVMCKIETVKDVDSKTAKKKKP